jgi:hypothetical protein
MAAGDGGMKCRLKGTKELRQWCLLVVFRRKRREKERGFHYLVLSTKRLPKKAAIVITVEGRTQMANQTEEIRMGKGEEQQNL